MAKPWARTEIGYLNHPKFLALTANAICLWHEGKQYCDMHHTDGLIPREALKTFRFRGVKSVALLLSTCPTPKPNGEAYSPLWEDHPVGYKMHDYLDYNDCRDEILARMGDADDTAEIRRLANAKRQAEYRAKRKAELEALRNGTNRVTCPTPTETETPTETSTPVATEQQQGGTAAAPPRPRPLAPIHDTSHRKHAVCGRVCLHASLFHDFVRRRNHDRADDEIRAWANGIIDAWTMGAFQAVEPGDPFAFWKARYAEQWPAPAVANASQPGWLQRVNARKAARS